MKDITFTGEFNSYAGAPRNDGDIVKLNFIISATDKIGPSLLKAFGKTVDVYFTRQGEETEMGGTVAEFKKLAAAAKTDGDILRVGFTIRAHDPITLKLLPEQGNPLTVRVSPDGAQTELFPEDDEELETDHEEEKEFEGLKIEP